MPRQVPETVSQRFLHGANILMLPEGPSFGPMKIETLWDTIHGLRELSCVGPVSAHSARTWAQHMIEAPSTIHRVLSFPGSSSCGSFFSLLYVCRRIGPQEKKERKEGPLEHMLWSKKTYGRPSTAMSPESFPDSCLTGLLLSLYGPVSTQESVSFPHGCRLTRVWPIK